jgi:HK97 family phage prohead protease
MTTMTTLHLKDKSPALEMRRAQVKLSAKAVTAEGQFEGYGSVFGNEDSYGDVVAEGAFADSLKAHSAEGTMPALLWQHDPSQPIGVYTEMREDKRGLFVKGELALDTQRGQEAHSLLKRGALNGLSIGYMPKRWEFDEDNNVLTLLEVDLWEVSLVTFPANTQARVSGVKAKRRIEAIDNWKSFEAVLREEGGFSNDAAAVMAAKARAIRDAELKTREDLTEFGAAQARLAHLFNE